MSYDFKTYNFIYNKAEDLVKKTGGVIA